MCVSTASKWAHVSVWVGPGEQCSDRSSGAQALGKVAGLQSLGVSQCSGVTGEGLLQLMPCWPALTRLTFNCLHLTADHVDTLVKVQPCHFCPCLGHSAILHCPTAI